jgi:hypothetical protein
MKKLPNKLSALLRLAVSDAQKCEADPRYELDMGRWHEPITWEGNDGKDRCAVCMAGAILAQTFELLPSEEASPDGIMGIDGELDTTFDMHTQQTLVLVDSMRRGNLYHEIRNGYVWGVTADHLPALREFDKVINFYFHDNGDDCRVEWSTYLKGADLLEAAGL